ncbi:hypothetical protein CkaCkLH20_05144 [Colletotrichum karsti]|uniref:Rhodopsin domain-containing protein n=1 Tax=Colletotrichum karsti TaxID=1095194 RepID=A0A9P6I732_9PEZI|nr:uncharacterized protein CkaCkLH20_05144 [Colletotrichum karsti]KAF9877444.1 hypothetical protein CkaCkLH20_05144 [Colletotrichum karsti]
MWALTAITLVFVVLRIYTRAFIVKSYGIDDHVYLLAFILLVLYTTFTTFSAHYGFGQSLRDIPDPDDAVQAILFEAIGQTFAVVGMAVAKWSLGLFLLRLVNKKWHKIVIWISMGCLMGASISTCFVFWLQCTPPSYLWDRRIPGGFCSVDSTPVSMLLCILCVTVDFFYAVFPWFFIWSLQMNSREKIVVLGSLSLGIFAGACGIKRTIEVPQLSSSDYLNDTVGLIVWSAAEIAVTMICIGIPVCRPLYKRYLEKLTSRDSDKYPEHSEGASYGLRTFGGAPMHPGQQVKDDEGSDGADSITKTERKLGFGGPFTKSYATGGKPVTGDNQSDEEILGPDFRRSQRAATGSPDKITVTYEVHTSSS